MQHVFDLFIQLSVQFVKLKCVHYTSSTVGPLFSIKVYCAFHI